MPVTYTCDEVPKGADPFSLIGPATIYCTSDADLNGVWSGPPPECRGCWDLFFYVPLYYKLCDSKTSRSVPFLEGGGMDLPIEMKKTDPLVLNLG